MKRTLLLIVISAISGSVMAQSPATTANQQSQDSKQVVVNEKDKAVDAKQVVKESKLFSSKQKQVLSNDYKHARDQYQSNMKVLKANKDLSAEQYTAQKEKINADYAAYKNKYTQQKQELDNSVQYARQAASDGVITPEESAKIKKDREQGVAQYKLDKKQNNTKKQKQKQS